MSGSYLTEIDLSIYTKMNLTIFVSSLRHGHNKSQPVLKSTDGVQFNEVLDLNDHVADQGVFWTYFELDDNDGHLYFLWRMVGMLILDEQGHEIEIDVSDVNGYQHTKTCAQFTMRSILQDKGRNSQ